MIIFEYSARYIAAKNKPAYSTRLPATNSDSASTISKGDLKVSAKIEIKNKKEIGNKTQKLEIKI